MRLHAPLSIAAAAALFAAILPTAAAFHAPAVCSDSSPSPVTPTTPPLACSFTVFCDPLHPGPCAWELHASLAGEVGVAHEQTSWGPTCVGLVNCSVPPTVVVLAPGQKATFSCNSGPLTNLAAPTWGVWMRCLALPK